MAYVCHREELNSHRGEGIQFQSIQTACAKALRCRVHGAPWEGQGTRRAQGAQRSWGLLEMWARPETGSSICHLRVVKPEDLKQEGDHDQICTFEQITPRGSWVESRYEVPPEGKQVGGHCCPAKPTSTPSFHPRRPGSAPTLPPALALHTHSRRKAPASANEAATSLIFFPQMSAPPPSSAGLVHPRTLL